MRCSLVMVVGLFSGCALSSAQKPVVISPNVAVDAQRSSLVVEHGVYSVHLIQRTIGTEEYDITEMW
jgi:hypothetical protein